MRKQKIAPGWMRRSLWGIIFIGFSTLLTAQNVRLFGANQVGASDGLGAIYSLPPDGNGFEVVHEFTYTNPGKYPLGDLVEYGGKLYGLTSQGGISGYGVIFSWDPATGAHEKLHVFDQTNGKNPQGSLTLYDGKLYGMTSRGGATDLGTIFSWDPATNTFTKMMEFPGTYSTDILGSYPTGNLAVCGGKLYGTTTAGGTNDKGVLFSFDPVSGAYAKLRDFSTAGGTSPGPNLCVFEDKIYGVMRMGGAYGKGVLFAYDPVNDAWTNLHDFTGSNARNPVDGVIPFQGKLYGMAGTGYYNYVVIYSWDPALQQYVEVYMASSTAQGAYSPGRLTEHNGLLYGMTSMGGEWPGVGVIFSFDPVASGYTVLHDFNITDGSEPYGGLLLYEEKLYGLASGKFSGDNIRGPYGVLFSLDLATGIFQKHLDFNYNNGGQLRGRMVQYDDGLLYGLVNVDGQYGVGANIFSLNPKTGVYTVVKQIGGGYSLAIYDALCVYEGKIYGVLGESNPSGAPYECVLFSFDPVSGEFNVLTPIDGMGFSQPYGYNGKLYGASSGPGGEWWYGDIYAYDLATGVYNSIEKFADPAMGNWPMGGVTEYQGLLYGTTNGGGNYNYGVVFSIDPATDTYTRRADFGEADGSPEGTMALLNGKLYGLATGLWNGTYYPVILYCFDPETNTITAVRTFSQEECQWPFGSLLAYQNRLYGSNGRGGTLGNGSVFAYDPVQDVLEVLHEFSLAEGSYCRASLTLAQLYPVQSAIQQLIVAVEALGLGKGLEQALTVKLEHALASYEDCLPEDAVGHLWSFIHQVEAKRGKDIPVAVADALIADAQELIDYILANGNTDCLPVQPRMPVPETHALTVYPNPATDVVNITFRLPEPGRIALRLYDLQGRLVHTFTDAFLPAGEPRFHWNFAGAEAGVYVLRLQTVNGTESKRVVRMKS